MFYRHRRRPSSWVWQAVALPWYDDIYIGCTLLPPPLLGVNKLLLFKPTAKERRRLHYSIINNKVEKVDRKRSTSAPCMTTYALFLAWARSITPSPKTMTNITWHNLESWQLFHVFVTRCIKALEICIFWYFSMSSHICRKAQWFNWEQGGNEPVWPSTRLPHHRFSFFCLFVLWKREIITLLPFATDIMILLLKPLFPQSPYHHFATTYT